MKNKKKKIVFWGAGAIGSACVRYREEVRPDFIIDTNKKNGVVENVKIISPEEVDDWEDLYIVITIKKDKIRKEIEEYIRDKGVAGYCYYENYFGRINLSYEESIREIYDNETEFQNACFIIAPILTLRNAEIFQSFIKRYTMYRKKEKFVFITNFNVLSQEQCLSEYGGYVLMLPLFNELKCDDSTKDYEDIINNIYERKRKPEWSKEQIRIAAKYYEILFTQLKPLQVVYWSGWSIESYLLRELTEKYEIPFRIMEFGFIAGTYQLDREGIMGQGEFAQIKEKCLPDITNEESIEISKVKKYILDNKLDTVKFIDLPKDTNNLKQLNKDRKTIFLVGMDDDGMNLNPDNWYWKKYVSEYVRSTEDALRKLIPICKKNKWNLIYKPHPSNKIPEWMKTTDDFILIQKMQIDKLLMCSDVVVSLTSAVDFRALMYEIPLVQLGFNPIYGTGASYTIKNINELEESMISAIQYGMTDFQKQQYDKLLHLLLTKYLWDDLTDREIRYGLGVEVDFYG